MPQRYIQTQGSCRDGFNIHIRAAVPQPHDGALSVCFLNLGQRCVQRFHLLCVHIARFSHRCSILRCLCHIFLLYSVSFVFSN